MRTTLRRTGLAAVVLGLALGATACSSGSSSGSTSSSAPSTATSTTSTPSDSVSGSSANATFGAGCAAVPASGSGSFQGMAVDPVATAASHNPVLSTLVTAVTAAGLGDTLNTADGITVFAPSNDAFKAMDQATLKKALADPKGLLTTVLTYHVVAGRLSPAQLAGTHKTLQGTTLTVAGSGTDFTVNGSAKVICGNVQTANATVYIIDGVLSPAA